MQVDPLLWSIVKDGVRRGLTECQKVFDSNRWGCPMDMYKKLPIFDNTTYPYGKFTVVTFCSIFYSRTKLSIPLKIRLMN